MGTSCEIVRVQDGILRQIHISYDGYLSGVGLELFRYYDTPAKVDALFSYETSATSLEPDPVDMSWGEWEESYKGMPVEKYLEDLERETLNHSVPSLPENGEKLLLALGMMGGIKVGGAAVREPGITTVNTVFRDLPEGMLAKLPDVVEEVFGKRLPDSYFIWGTIQSIANLAARPEDHDGDPDDDYGHCFIYSHGKWAWPHTIRDLRNFIETGETAFELNRDLFIEDMDEEDFEAAMKTAPSRPVNEVIGTLIIDEDSQMIQQGREKYRINVADLPEDWNGKTVRVRYSAMGFSASTGGGSESWMTISEMELVN